MKRLIDKMTFPLRMAARSQEIGIILSSQGIAGSLGSLGIEAGKRGLRILNWTSARPPTPVGFDAVFGRNLARTFVRLGPTFIKLGQILASRPDLVGEPVANELQVLLDRVPNISFRRIRKILRRELGRQKIASHFKSIDPKPLASASISQTHRAVLTDDTPVILKVQKPRASDTVRLDLAILEGLVWPIHVVYPKLNLLQVFEDFKHATLREIDYLEEAKNIDRFRKNYRKIFSQSDVMFPRYFPELTTSRVIALEPMHGRKMADLKKGSTVARRAATAGLSAVLEQIFDHGFFHADPHAGNLFFLEDEGKLGFIDLGLVGQLEPEDKRKFLKVLLAILQRDRERLAKHLFELGTPNKKADFRAFESDIQRLLDEVKRAGIDNLRMDEMVSRLMGISRANGLVIPNRYILMIRSCLLIEGVAKSLDPNISVFKIATPIVAKSLMKTYSPLNLLRRLI